MSYKFLYGEHRMLSIRLKPALERRLCASHGRRSHKTFYATKLIEENIEDLEDRYLAKLASKIAASATPPPRSRRQLGLDD